MLCLDLGVEADEAMDILPWGCGLWKLKATGLGIYAVLLLSCSGLEVKQSYLLSNIQSFVFNHKYTRRIEKSALSIGSVSITASEDLIQFRNMGLGLIKPHMVEF